MELITTRSAGGTTILGQWQGQGTFCLLCQGSDHLNVQCVLASLHQPAMAPLLPLLDINTQRHQSRRPNYPLHMCAPPGTWMPACSRVGETFCMCVQIVPWHTEPRIVLTHQKSPCTSMPGDVGMGQITGSQLSPHNCRVDQVEHKWRQHVTFQTAV